MNTHTLNMKPDKGERRNEPRRDCDICVAVMNGETLPIIDWCRTGVALHADDRLYATSQRVDLTVRFKLHDRTVDVNEQAEVVRKAHSTVVVKFLRPNEHTKRTFQAVIDDRNAVDFADSQV